MEAVFGSKYARYYDILYQDKNYAAESSNIDRIIKSHSSSTKTLLELGCGTGNHAMILADMGYKLTSVDRSQYMLEHAKKKSGSRNIEFVQSDITDLPKFKNKFDSCVSMFHVLNYLLTRRDLVNVLKRIHSMIDRKGLLIFDSWNGLAVLTEGPTTRVKEAQRDGLRVIRTVEPKLDVFKNICENSYHVMVIKDDKLVDEYREVHRIKYLLPNEIPEILEESNFQLVQLTADDGKPLKSSDWSMLIVAKPA